jgi:signal transduction histidine kinase
MDALSATRAGSGEVDRAGRLALAAVVLVGVVAAVGMSEAPPTEPENLAIVALGLGILGLAWRWGERLERAGHPERTLYFVTQIGLAAAILALQSRLGSFGMGWLVLLPLLAQAMFIYSWKGLTILSAAALLLPVAHVWRLAGPAAALEACLGVGAAIVFVLLFSATAVRERRARSRSESLREELAAANRALARQASQVAELAAERERTRLAREIHDSVGHGLTVAHVQIGAARVHLRRDREQAESALVKAEAAVRQGLGELRRSVAGLRGSPLDDRSVVEALEGLCDDASPEGVRSELRVVGEARPIGRDAALTLFRAAQEGLTNVRRHSRARHVELILDFRERRVGLQVRDDGVGPREGPNRGFGLIGVRERVRLCGGEFSAGPAPGGGFRIAVEIPA